MLTTDVAGTTFVYRDYDVNIAVYDFVFDDVVSDIQTMGR